MPHTQSRYQQDLGFNDARIFCGPGDLVTSTSAGTLTTTRNAAGQWTVVAANTTTGQIAVNLTQQILRRTGFGEDIQEQFGGAGIPASAQPQFYRPDLGVLLQASAQQLTPRSALKIKGFKLLSFDVIYLVVSAAATAVTCRVDSLTLTNGAVVPAPTAVLASGINGLVTTRNDTLINVINVPVPNGTYVTTADTTVFIELGLQTPGGGTINFAGFDVLVEYNYN